MELGVGRPLTLVRKRAAAQRLALPVTEHHEEDGRRQKHTDSYQDADDDGQVGRLLLPFGFFTLCNPGIKDGIINRAR